jgi:acetyl-CoA C-acetyltransferase
MDNKRRRREPSAPDPFSSFHPDPTGKIMRSSSSPDVWLAAGVRTPFSKVDGALASLDAIGLSVPVVKHMVAQLGGALPDFTVWGAVVPNLTWSNLAREVLMDAGLPPTIPAVTGNRRRG